MAIASQSLFNMTVASDNAGGNQGLLMPKLQFRFRVNFLNFGVKIPISISELKLPLDHFLNIRAKHFFYLFPNK